MTATSLDALRDSLTAPKQPKAKPVDDGMTPEYRAKQWHAIPDASVVVRETFILERVKGKRVLEFGASGPMHEAIVKVATFVLGVDRHDGPSIIGFDLDDIQLEDLPDWNTAAGYTPADVIVCGEVIEHLSNPGWFLKRLKSQYPNVPVIITVPNAHCSSNDKYVAGGHENVNIDHVAWYSHRTLQTLLSRVGYPINEFYWYRGHPRTAEGLIVVTQ